MQWRQPYHTVFRRGLQHNHRLAPSAMPANIVYYIPARCYGERAAFRKNLGSRFHGCVKKRATGRGFWLIHPGTGRNRIQNREGVVCRSPWYGSSRRRWRAGQARKAGASPDSWRRHQTRLISPLSANYPSAHPGQGLLGIRRLPTVCPRYHRKTGSPYPFAWSGPHHAPGSVSPPSY